MLAGEGAIAIWNGIAKEARTEFYAWHLHEHMPERVGIPGFLRGRRYRAADKLTSPEFFTLYETESFEVIQGVDYLNRLNSPTPWTRTTTAHFQNTSRALTRVLASFGCGSGGALLTLRFDLDGDVVAEREKIKTTMMKLTQMPEVTGAHLLCSDDMASAAETTESKGRKDIVDPPRWATLVEACSAKALKPVLTLLRRHPALKRGTAGTYLHEYTRLKTASGMG